MIRLSSLLYFTLMATNYVDEGFFKAVWQHETWYNNHIESGVNANCKKKEDINLCGRRFLKNWIASDHSAPF